MRLSDAIAWLDDTLSLASFNDVSNNGLQIAREGGNVESVAFGVDASASFVNAAADSGAQLCVVHHGISWGGGIRRITGSAYEVVKAAVRRNVALYAAHLPLDANPAVGNNHEIARALGLADIQKAFTYNGNVIGVTGIAQEDRDVELGEAKFALRRGWKVGVCSGGAGEDAEAAKALGCDIFITGEASWGDVVAARNVGMKMVLAGHYATETFGVKALAAAMSKAFPSTRAFFIDEREGTGNGL